MSAPSADLGTDDLEFQVNMVTQWYDPEHGSAAIPASMARAVKRRGLGLRVLTGFPNYPYGRIYEGYHWRWRRLETIDGIQVCRVPYLPSHERSAFRRMVSYLSFAGVASLHGARSAARGDVTLVYSTPATVVLPALVARMLGGAPYVLHIADLWPDTVIESGMLSSRALKAGASKILTGLCAYTYRHAAMITVPSAGMYALLVERGVPEEKLRIVHHWVDEDLYKPLPPSKRFRESLGLEDKFIAMYAGSLGDLQGLEVAVRAAELLKDVPDFTLVLLGTGVAEGRLRALVSDLHLSNVVFAPARPPSEMATVMQSADVQLVTLLDLPLFRATIPSKVQAILACGCPIVSSAPGDTMQLVADSGAGIGCPAEDPGALAEAMRQVHAMTAAERTALGRAGRLYYDEHLSEKVGSARLAETLLEAGRRCS